MVVRGHENGLYPGLTRPMLVRVRNPESFAVRLTRVTARVSSPSRACRARNVWIASFTGSRRIPARGRIRIYLSSGMRSMAPNICQGARFPVTFTATLVRA